MGKSNKWDRIPNRVQGVLNGFVDNKTIYGVCLCLQADKNNFSWEGAAGNLEVQSSYFLTSVAKLHITALILKFRVRGLLDLNDKISSYLSQEIFRGLPEDITLKDLLTHTSCLPDYFQQKKGKDSNLKKELLEGKDQFWTFQEMIQQVKEMKTANYSRPKKNILYSDTNFQLLGKIIETIAGKKLEEVIEEFHFRPLGLNLTYTYKNVKDRTPVPFYYRQKPLIIPRAMTSFGPDGGLVGTAKESMVFLRAFFHGHLFPLEYLPEIQQWKSLGKGFFYGWGVSRYEAPWWYAPFQKRPNLLGHSGMSGAFSFYYPEGEIFFTGTVNQLADKSLPYKLVLKVISELK